MVNKIIKIFIYFILSLFFIIPKNTLATGFAPNHWTIRNYRSEIKINNDSTISVTENISADCEYYPNNYGIYRNVHTAINSEIGQIKTPIYLQSITDFDNHPYHYHTEYSPQDNYIKWLIGDYGKEVRGINNYKIKYEIRNALIKHSNLDEIYLALVFDTDYIIDNYSAQITLPNGINHDNTKIYMYSGNLEEGKNTHVKYQWQNNNIIKIDSTNQLRNSQGVTITLNFPKNIIQPYHPRLTDYYHNVNEFLWLVLPLIILIICFIFWLIHGRDPKITDPIVPEFSIPENLNPLELGMIYTNGKMFSSYISAAIIHLAVKGVFEIETIPDQDNDIKDYKITIKNYNPKTISHCERHLINDLFGIVLDQNQPLDKKYKYDLMVSDIKKDFLNTVEHLQNYVTARLEYKFYLDSNGRSIKRLMFGLVPLIIIVYFYFGLFTYNSFFINFSITLTIIILIFFAIIMPQRTIRAADCYKKILGFRLYLQTAEQYRQQFNEKEGIFEKYLPYAILFGFADRWTFAFQGNNEDKGHDIVKRLSWLVGVDYTSLNFHGLSSYISCLSKNLSSIAGPGWPGNINAREAIGYSGITFFNNDKK